MKILVTGGHISPALAVIDELLKKKKVELTYVGKKYAYANDTSPTLEFKEIQARKIPFFHLDAGRMARLATVNSFLNFVKIPVGIFRAWKIVKETKPDVILSFGGYIALPIALVGWFLKIPIFTHEQTIHPGIANRIIAHFARTVFISFEQSKKYFPRSKIKLSGNPVRKNVFESDTQPLVANKDRPVLYITGGSLGAHSINLLVRSCLIILLQKYIIIHQTGNVADYKDFEMLDEVKKTLPKNIQNRYFLRRNFMGGEIGSVYKSADLVIGRSGANTFFELIALKKPAIFIPLPWSSGDEQMEHALVFKSNGVGEIFLQSDSPQTLLSLIEKMVKNLSYYQANFKNLTGLYKDNAASTIVKEILAKG